MCIIAIVPKNKALPNKDVLETCFVNNPDGIGYMFTTRDNKVKVVKGFSKFKTFYKAIQSDKALNDSSPFIIHFRIATQGFNLKCTQPFVISDNILKLKSSQQYGKIGIAHNGIIDLTTEYLRKWDKTAKKWIDTEPPYSDTMAFITRYLSLLDNPMSKKSLKLIDNLSNNSNRFVLLDGKGDYKTVGNWVQNGDYLFSNETFKPRVTTKPYGLDYHDYRKSDYYPCYTCVDGDCQNCTKVYQW